MIFDREPTDWADLQNLVAQMFLELGCDVGVGQHVDLVRGKKEIDVLVKDPETTPTSQYLCECKFWSKPIPQEVVHSFRTIVSDYGAHRGFVISRAGFQSGAREAVQKTNVDLVTFEELQGIFVGRWRVSMGKRFMPYADRLFPYWDFPGRQPKIKWTPWHVEKQQLLTEAYLPLVNLGPTLERGGFQWKLPMILPQLDDQRNCVGEIALGTARQVYDFIDAKKDVALRDFQVIYGEIEA
ncbi:MAG: restriction endonuclease [Steroidobacteraceae bacterium]